MHSSMVYNSFTKKQVFIPPFSLSFLLVSQLRKKNLVKLHDESIKKEDICNVNAEERSTPLEVFLLASNKTV